MARPQAEAISAWRGLVGIGLAGDTLTGTRKSPPQGMKVGGNPTRVRQPAGLGCIEQAIYRRAGKVLGGADAGEGEVGGVGQRES
jgi:hypothetical protein